jgi:hypothetical protein
VKLGAKYNDKSNPAINCGAIYNDKKTNVKKWIIFLKGLNDDSSKNFPDSGSNTNNFPD